MTESFKLPEIGEGVVEGEIVEWHVTVGEQVAPDQPMVSVLTDKATVEIASSFNGVIASITGEPGDLVEVGSVLLTYGGEGEKPEPQVPEAPKNVGHATAEVSKGAVVDFPLPEIGEGVVEGELVQWLAAVGDTVERDQPVLSVLTDKATVEITSPADGQVLEVFGEPGDLIGVGAVLMKIQSSDGSGVPAVSEPDSVAPVPMPAAAPGVSAPVVPTDNPSISAFGTPLATPAVRRLAAANGLDLNGLRGSGPNHRITRTDVLTALEAPAPAPVVPAAAKSAPPAPAFAVPVNQGGETREKIRGLRKAIYGSMIRSKSTIPHFTYVDEVEMDKLVALRGNLKQMAAEQDVKLTFLPFVVKAVVYALKKFPILNASVDDAAGEIVYKHDYNIGIATATPSGLTVPVLKGADLKPILQCAREIAEISGRARNKRSTMEDITGGTFTITSLGRIGGLLATPIINHPEVGIMGIHNLQERAVVRDGQIVIRKMMNISLSFDHRVVDGDVGATFAQEVKSYLEEPGKLMLSMT